MRHKNTTRLPTSLLEQIQQDQNFPRPNSKRKPIQSRKESRKEERALKKQRKTQFFSASKRHAVGEHADSPQPKKLKLNVPPPPVPLANTKTEERRVKPKKSPKPPKVQSLKSSRSRVEQEEDNYIAYLEAKLGVGKKKGESFPDDGLDDLFEFANTLTFAQPDVASQSETLEEDNESEEEDQEEGSESRTTSDEEDSEENGNEWGGISESIGADEQTVEEPPAPVPAEPAKRYIPPHLRAQQSGGDSEATIRLQKQLKGLLNRMSEQNLASILDGIEEIYRNQRRHDVTSTITKLIIDGTTSHSSLLDSYVVLYAALIAALHKILGVEFAAYIVQSVVSSYEQFYTTLETAPNPSTAQDETIGKEASNLIILLSELYNFQVISSVLVFDIIRALLAKPLSEFNVELLLKLLRSSGQQLRTDDPLALKDIVQIVHNKVSDQHEALSSRTRFMIETLTNLKNNKLKRNTTQNQGGDAVERMKKFLSGIGRKRHVSAHEPLRVSLEDLHSAETKGKWWLVGAAWGGDPLVDRQQETLNSQIVSATTTESAGTSGLLQLAKKHGMNTDIRRSIFVVLLSSEDYIDACDRLSQLNLTEVQQREIIRVLLHCCGNEKTYNPYYSLIGQHLCGLSHAHKITLQYCLWDFLRDLGETAVGGHEIIKNLNDNDDTSPRKQVSSARILNMAKAYAWWLAKDALSLNILKPIDFTNLKPQTTTFLRQLFENLFISSQSSTPNLAAVPDTARNRNAIEEIFLKVTHVPSLATGIIVFLSTAFKEQKECLFVWACDVALNTLRTGLDIIPGL